MKPWFSLNDAIPRPRRVAFSEARGKAVPLAVRPASAAPEFSVATPVRLHTCKACGYHEHSPGCPIAPAAPVAKAAPEDIGIADVLPGLPVTLGKVAGWTSDDVPGWYTCSLHRGGARCAKPAKWWRGEHRVELLSGHGANETIPALCDACHARETGVATGVVWEANGHACLEARGPGYYANVCWYAHGAATSAVLGSWSMGTLSFKTKDEAIAHVEQWLASQGAP